LDENQIKCIKESNITNHEQIMKQFTCIASCESVELNQDKFVNRGDRVMKVDSCEKIDELPVYLHNHDLDLPKIWQPKYFQDALIVKVVPKHSLYY
jgi:hypothetical protein